MPMNALLSLLAAITLAQASMAPIEPAITTGIQNASSFTVHRLSREDMLALKLAEVGVRPGLTIEDAVKVAKIKEVLLSPATYNPPPSLQKSCPFWPNVAVRFTTADGRPLWLLIAQGCESARYTEETGNWRASRILNVTPAAMQMLLGLLQ
jgi:hypothetical protein